MYENSLSLIEYKPSLVSRKEAECEDLENCIEYFSKGRFKLVVNEETSLIKEFQYLGESFQTNYTDLQMEIKKPREYEVIRDSQKAKNVYDGFCSEVQELNEFYLCETISIEEKPH